MKAIDLNKRAQASVHESARRTLFVADKKGDTRSTNRAPARHRLRGSQDPKENHAEVERRLVSFLVKTVTSPTFSAPAPSSTDDLGTIKKAVDAVIAAARDGTLTPPERDAVLEIIAEGYVTRRINRILEKISEAPKFEGRFVTRARSTHER